jgi:guanylate kinase
MDTAEHRRLDELAEKFHRSKLERLIELTSRGILQLLPGGPLFDAWICGLEETSDIEAALTLLYASIQEVQTDKASRDELRRVEASGISYLQTFERVFSRQLDSSNQLHTQILELLSKLNPPPMTGSTNIFLISGPSCSGKDALAYAVRKSLRERGYGCEFVLKYTTRSPRQSELSPEYSRTNYYKYVSESEFMTLKGSGEIILDYSKYGYYYGLSRAQLEANATQRVTTIGIVSDYRKMRSSMQTLRSFRLRVVSILVYAPMADCGRRLRFRDVPDAGRRMEELEADCRYIDTHSDEVASTYVFRLENGDNVPFNDASTRLYKWIEGMLRSDSVHA